MIEPSYHGGTRCRPRTGPINAPAPSRRCAVASFSSRRTPGPSLAGRRSWRNHL